ncbi:MAG: hypothetical protein K6U80_13215 [Firmicutes bacterium]|nr:hypothetical protein [Bacillota bacterium]
MTETKNYDGFVRPNPIIGTPNEDALDFPGKQSYPDTCAIRCQESIIRQFTGIEMPESYYVKEATEHGWYTPGQGTSIKNVGKLLELHHIPVNYYEDANIFNLTSELAQGHKVIIGVNSAELWQDGSPLQDIFHKFGLSRADHAVVVTGIDTTDPDHVKVIISDPGTGQAEAVYPMEQFVESWKDSHFIMIATQNPPPQDMHLPEMSNFNYDMGHITHIGAMQYEDLEKMMQENPVSFSGHVRDEQKDNGYFGINEHDHPIIDSMAERVNTMLDFIKGGGAIGLLNNVFNHEVGHETLAPMDTHDYQTSLEGVNEVAPTYHSEIHELNVHHEPVSLESEHVQTSDDIADNPDTDTGWDHHSE